MADADLARGRVVVLAGPRVVDEGALDGLRTFAAAGNLGVANTWGAKGVFAWDSPHHLGTCGLQALDFELLGFRDADVIVATGTVEDESPRARFALAPVIDIEPTDLADTAGRVVAEGPPLDNQLYPRLAAIAQPGYVDGKIPLHPARAVADLGAVLPPGGLVAADPGVAGLWVARTFPTPSLAPGEPRRVVVPSRREPGAAASLAIEAALAGRPAIAVTTAPLDDATMRVWGHAPEDAHSLALVVWNHTGYLEHADEHRDRLAKAVEAPGPTVLAVPVGLGDTDLLVEAAGEVVAWGGL